LGSALPLPPSLECGGNEEARQVERVRESERARERERARESELQRKRESERKRAKESERERRHARLFPQPEPLNTAVSSVSVYLASPIWRARQHIIHLGRKEYI